MNIYLNRYSEVNNINEYTVGNNLQQLKTLIGEKVD